MDAHTCAKISPKISFGTRHLFAPSSSTLEDRQEVNGLGYPRTENCRSKIASAEEDDCAGLRYLCPASAEEDKHAGTAVSQSRE